MYKPTKKTSKTSGPRTRAMNQATFDTVPISPPPADKRYPYASMKAFNDTKKEEVAVLQHLLLKDVPNPCKGPLNIKLRKYAPHNGFKDAVYQDVIELLFNEDMSDLDVYVSNQDLINVVFRVTAVDTNLDMRKDTRLETVRRYVYSEPVADYLLLASKSNCNRPTEMPSLQERAREDSDSSSNEEETEELKTEASYEELQLLDSRKYTQVLIGTLASHSEPIDYDKIISNKYDPLKVDSDSEGTLTVPENPDNMEQDLHEFHENQDLLTAQVNEESSLDAEAQDEYENEDRYRRERQEYEESGKERKVEAEVRERQQQHQHQQRLSEQEESEGEHSVFNQVRMMMNQIKRDQASITDIPNQVTIERTVISDIADEMEKQVKVVTIDTAAIAMLKKHISEERALITTEASRIRTEVTDFRSIKTEAKPVFETKHRQSRSKPTK